MHKSLLESLDRDQSQWRCDAACRDTDPDLFFPIGSTGLALEQIELAKSVCQACVARTDCLEFALTTNQDSGIWGGLSEEERRQIRRRRKAERLRVSVVGV
ncbi:WhiB family transcriptional regulator [Candidatus Poriferisocius sp.]|uniref:WhiB family transcriptional regulator n=1 Tax=Candidatus Poriferisocius sp. TaxID=3101276 RepID=UPI003B0236BE